MKVSIRFWGVRGSTPSPLARAMKYGGNTPCIEVKAGRDLIICDAGTGIRLLGRKMVRERERAHALILLSHLHWDHISGLSFFEPIYSGKNSFDIVGPDLGRTSFKKALIRAVSPPYFPVPLKDVPAALKIKGVTARPFSFGKVRIRPHPLSHPGGAFGWRFEFPGGKSMVYISDNEPAKETKDIIRWLKGADLMIHDAQFTPAEYRRHKGWGHSPYTYPLKLAAAADVGRLVLSHFSPESSDSELDKMYETIRKFKKRDGLKLKCELAREGKRYTI